MQPMDYRIQVQSPFEGALQGVQAGFNLSNAMDQAAARQQELVQKQFALEQQKQMQSDLGALAQKSNPTAKDFATITTKYPALAEHFKNTWSMMSQDQQQTRLGQASQVLAALNAGKPDIAKQLLDEQAAAAKNSGDEEGAKHASTMSQLVAMNPATAQTSVGLMLSSILGPDKFTSTFSTLAKLPGEVRQGNATATQKEYEARNTPQRLDLEARYKGAEIRNLDSQVGERAARLGLDRDKLQSETELKLYELGQKAGQLDDGARKLINDSTVASVAADQSSGQMLDLAGRLEKSGAGYGAFSSAAEWLKGTTGNQDALTQMRQEYTRLRNTQAIKMLPPGPATDKDIAVAMKGFPSDTADSSTMAAFLRGMAKLNQYNAVNESAKAEWVNSVGHLGKPKTDITIDGVKVPAGTTFVDFARQYMPSKTEQRGKEQGQAQVPNASYMKWLQSQGAK